MHLVRCETKQQPQGCHCTASLKASAGQLQRRRFANGVSTQASSAERRSTHAAGESLAMAARSVALSVFLLAVPLIPSAVASAEEGLLTCLQHQQGNSGLGTCACKSAPCVPSAVHVHSLVSRLMKHACTQHAPVHVYHHMINAWI